MHSRHLLILSEVTACTKTGYSGFLVNKLIVWEFGTVSCTNSGGHRSPFLAIANIPFCPAILVMRT